MIEIGGSKKPRLGKKHKFCGSRGEMCKFCGNRGKLINSLEIGGICNMHH